MVKLAFELNGGPIELDVDPRMPLLWVLRDLLHLTGTKLGCGRMLCGACTVHIDGQAMRTCQLPVAAAAGKRVITIEVLAPERSHPLQRAWIAEQVPQCGYCQSGQLMAAAALLSRVSRPSDAPGYRDQATRLPGYRLLFAEDTIGQLDEDPGLCVLLCAPLVRRALPSAARS